MKIHEFQGKALLRRFGVPVPDGDVATTSEEARRIAESLGGTVVVKAQIHAGGRGKGGGVKLAHSADEAARHARDILGMQLVTPQTGPEGQRVKQVLVEAGSDIQRELYAGIVLDRALGRSTVMVSAAGGMEIEEVAASTPDAILKEVVDPAIGLQSYQARRLAFGLDVDGKTANAIADVLLKLARVNEKLDCSLIEINPLVITADGAVLALDAKLNFDDSALFRHPDIADLRDLDEEDPAEVEAAEHQLSYVKLDGTVGCMVNGAGLAMATMDIIKLHNAEPANFLDVGGGATPERVAAAFRIILKDPNVRAVLVNIFGGIVQCDRVANGIVEAMGQAEVTVPVVVRLAGTNADLANEILDKADFEFIVANDLDDAAARVVAAIT